MNFGEACKRAHEACSENGMCVHAEEASHYMEEFDEEVEYLLRNISPSGINIRRLLQRALWNGIHIGITWKGQQDGEEGRASTNRSDRPLSNQRSHTRGRR